MRNPLFSLVTFWRWLVAILLVGTAPTWASNPVLQIRGTGHATAFNMKVALAKSSGRKSGSFSSAPTTPTTGFKPGETGFASTLALAKSMGEAPVMPPQVYQLVTAVSDSDPAVNSAPNNVALDAVDGELDLMTANVSDNKANGRPNVVPTITSFNPTSGVAGTSIILTGTGLTGATSVSVNGVAVTPTSVGSTSLTFVVPAGASNTQSITVTTPGGTSTASTAFTVRLNATSTSPVANALLAPLANSATTVTFTEPVTAASAANLKVFSTQLGGQKAGTRTVAGSTASFAATASTVRTNFKPGETVSVTVPASITNATGLAAGKRVFQFNTAVSGLGRGNFTGSLNPSVSNSAVSVVVGDVNGDGSLDLVTSNISTAVVSVRLNDGTGTYTGGSDPAVGSAAKGVVLGDVNGDGSLDLVTANDAASTASVRLNNGSGTFSGSQEVAVGGNPYCVALGDIDGDGDLDLLTGNAGGVNISTRFNDGTGTFSGGTEFTTSGYRLAGITLGDLDGDGDLDLAGASYSGAVLVRLNNGAGVFSSSTNLTVSNARMVALGDLDADGDLDLVAVVGDASGLASVWLNNGNATFTAGQNLTAGSQAYGVALGDVDADGDLDLAVASRIASSLNLYLNNGAGTFTSAPAVPIAAGSSSVAFGDVDGDGDLDLLATSDNTVSVRFNQAPAPTITSFTPTSGLTGTAVTITGTNLLGATAVAFNGTAAASFVVNSATQITATVATGTNTGTLSVTTPGGTGTSTGTFTVLLPMDVTALSPTRNALTAAIGTTVAVTLNQTPTAASAANLRVFSSQYKGLRTATAAVSGNTATLTLTGGNFRPGELVNVTIPTTVQTSAGIPTNKQVYQFTTAVSGTGRGNFLPGANLSNASAGEVVAADFNGDGTLDLADTGGGLQVRFGTGGGNYGAATTYAGAAGFFSLTAGDIDNDGDLDLVVPTNGGAISIMRNNGAGVFTAIASAASNGGDPRKAALGDIDGDGDLDMLVPISGGGGAVGVYFNNSLGAFSLNSSVSGATNAVYIVLGDVDRDGDLDYAVADYNNSRVVVRLNDGSGTFSGGSNVTVGAGPNGLALADVNGDGALDILTGNENTATLSVSLNTNAGTGAFGASSSLTLPNTTSGLAVGDVDADGDLDVVLGSRGATGWYPCLNSGAGTFTLGSTIAAPTSFFYLTLNDLDNDGDLDLAGASASGGLSIRLNQPLAPAITTVAVNPGGRGQSITITGTSLGSATALTINGANAFASIISNSATSVVARVPTTAAASGSISLTTAGGTASSGTFTLMSPPGNALAFDGVDDQLTTLATAPAFGTGSFTIEAWVLTSTTSTSNFVAVGSVSGNDYWLGISNRRACISVSGGGCVGTSLINDGRWHHLAGVRNGTQLTIYVDGQAETTISNNLGASPSAPLSIGNFGNSYFWPGSIDEVRLWNAVRVPTLTSRTTPALGTESGLVLAYNFDQGTPATASTGNNAGLVNLYDLVSGQPATLTAFALTSGNVSSNWVESYALVVPTATAATAAGSTGFTANWTAPTTGTVDNGYRVDVSTSSTFASVVSGSPFTASSGTSLAITGLAASTTYYYRVRADKTSVTDQGAFSNVITAATCAAPVAIAQNLTVTLNASGSISAAATAVNNGSTANCGVAAASTLSVSPATFGCADAVTPPTTNAALSFNGSTQYVEGTNANLPLGNAARTIEAWVYPTAAGQNSVIFNYGTPTNNQRAGILLIGGKLYYVGEFNDLSGATTLAVNAWSHVAATYDGTTLRLYVNGVLDAQSNPGAFNTTGTVWRIAQRSFPQTGEFLTGRVDEVRVWNVARTAAQLAAARVASLPGGSSGLVGYYRLNENSGSTTADASASNSAGTLYNAPTWTTGAPVTPGVTATLTVTDNSGNTSTATAIVTVRDNTAPAAPGSGPLPAAPTLATSNVPEAGNYGVLYQLDMPNAANFNGLSSIPYTVNNAGVSIVRPARVAYFMELQSGGVTKWAWVSMDNFASTLTQLGLPNPTANSVVWNQNVSNLNVFASSNAGVATGTSLGTGRLEMWSSNYETNNASSVPGASSSVYDFGDQPSAGNYGSFQVHNVTSAQTVLAYNNWGSNGGNSDLGIGNQVGGSGHPDWTFTNNAGSFTVKRLYILVPNNGAFTQPATVALGSSGTVTLTPSQVYTGAADNCAVSTVLITPNTFTCAQVGTPQLVTVAVSDASGNTTTQSAFVTLTVPPTATTTWNGSSSTSWTDCANWSFGKVPDAATNVIIPTGQPRYPVLATGTFPVLDLTINTGGTLTLNSGVTLQVNGNFANTGTATLSGTVSFVGSAATQTLSNGSGFTTVTVNKPSGTVQLAQSLTINSALTLSSGTLTTTASYQVNLGGSASLSESETSYVLGKVAVNRTLVPGSAQSFSGLGLTLTPATGSLAPGATLVTRTTGTAINGAGTSQSILRSFDIQPATNAGLNVTMNFAYFNHELNGIPVGNIALFKSVSGGTPWIPQRGTTASTNLITKTGITDFSVWTLGNSANPLPVELVAFTATAQHHAVQLKWSTASEKNTARFEVERSLDGTAFDRIGSVLAAGNSTTTQEYALLDEHLPASTLTLYYRLKQVDLDGTFSYSPVRSVRLSEAAEGLALFPNPATARTMLSGTQPGALVQVFDALGRVVAAATADATGSATLALPAGLATGVYVVRTGSKALRLTVE